MKNDYDNLNEGARSQKRAKRRKTNLILNSLIVVVILLIVFVSINIFFTNDESAADNSNVASENEKAANKDNDKKKDKKETAASKDEDKDESSENPDEDLEAEGEEEPEETGDPVVTEGGSDANVKQTTENPAWKPVGTTQTGEHPAAVFDQNSADWQEMVQAYSYATGIDAANMTVWWNENGGAPNTALGTVSQKGSDQTFRVYIEWVEGQGWKPVKVEELNQNDKR